MAGDAILVESHSVTLLPQAVDSDVATFESLIAKEDPVSLAAAVELLGGPFALGLATKEDEFEEWLRAERTRLAELSITGLGALLRRCEGEADFETGAVIARKLLAVDPLQEAVHRSLMHCLAGVERYESALQQYKACRDLLRKELNIPPSPKTEALNEEIARRRLHGKQIVYAPAVETSGLIQVIERDATDGSPLPAGVPPQLARLNLKPPERPSIVILPFRTLTGRAEDDHIAEGLRIDIQAALVKITGLMLIAAGSANAFRGAAPDHAAKALGVGYVLDGGVRRSGDDLRISCELIDGRARQTVWSEVFDCRLDESVDVQDRIVDRIVTALDVKLLHGEQARVWHKTLKDRQSLQLFYKGVDEFFKMQKPSNARARELFEAVDERQPNVSIGATWAALCHWFDAFKRWSPDPSASLERAGDWARKAVVMEDADGQAHMVLSHVHLLNRRFDDALIVGREAVALRPNCTNANGFFGNVLHYCGEQSDAIDHVTWAIRYSPVYPPLFADILALAYLLTEENPAAIALASESLRINPSGTTARLVLAAAHQSLGNLGEARSLGAEILSADPAFALGAFAKQQPYRNEADKTNFTAKLRAAGLPE